MKADDKTTTAMSADDEESGFSMGDQTAASSRSSSWSRKPAKRVNKKSANYARTKAARQAKRGGKTKGWSETDNELFLSIYNGSKSIDDLVNVRR